MADEAQTDDPTAYALAAAAAEMAAVDDALEPIRRLAASPQPMNTAHMATVAACIRQALSVLVYGPPAKPDVVDDGAVDDNAPAAANAPVAAAVDEAPGEQPDDGTAGEDEPAAETADTAA